MKIVLSTFFVILSLVFQPVSQAGDPTKPDRAAPSKGRAKQSLSLRLSMIITSAKGHRAVINGRSLSVGDRIANYRIKTINTTEVLLDNAKGQIRLQLLGKGALRKTL